MLAGSGDRTSCRKSHATRGKSLMRETSNGIVGVTIITVVVLFVVVFRSQLFGCLQEFQAQDLNLCIILIVVGQCHAGILDLLAQLASPTCVLLRKRRKVRMLYQHEGSAATVSACHGDSVGGSCGIGSGESLQQCYLNLRGILNSQWL
jgi:hypothetical protein